jgi:hypothetical protein
MEMTEARRRLEGLTARARLNWPGRVADHVEQVIVRMIVVAEVQDDCLELAAMIREQRAAEGWPGSLRSWLWFDEKLFALADALDCTPQVARVCAGTRARVTASWGPS